MYLLKFFLDWGKNGLGVLWLVYALLSIWFLYQAVQGYRSGWYKVDPKTGLTSGTEKLKWYQYHKFSFLWLGITVAAIVIHLLIQSDYK